MPAPRSRRELRRFAERMKGQEGIYRRSFNKIAIVQVEAIREESDQKLLRIALKNRRRVRPSDTR